MKTYQKPELYFESFELSQHIAGGCLMEVNNAPEADGSSCTMSGVLLNPALPGGSFEIVNGFRAWDTDCAENGSIIENYCYQTGAESIPNLHAS